MLGCKSGVGGGRVIQSSQVIDIHLGPASCNRCTGLTKWNQGICVLGTRAFVQWEPGHLCTGNQGIRALGTRGIFTLLIAYTQATRVVNQATPKNSELHSTATEPQDMSQHFNGHIILFIRS